jgi:hypothetical protein
MALPFFFLLTVVELSPGASRPAGLAARARKRATAPPPGPGTAPSAACNSHPPNGGPFYRRPPNG